MNHFIPGFQIRSRPHPGHKPLLASRIPPDLLGSWGHLVLISIDTLSLSFLYLTDVPPHPTPPPTIILAAVLGCIPGTRLARCQMERRGAPRVQAPHTANVPPLVEPLLSSPPPPPFAFPFGAFSPSPPRSVSLFFFFVCPLRSHQADARCLVAGPACSPVGSNSKPASPPLS